MKPQTITTKLVPSHHLVDGVLKSSLPPRRWRRSRVRLPNLRKRINSLTNRKNSATPHFEAGEHTRLRNWPAGQSEWRAPSSLWLCRWAGTQSVSVTHIKRHPHVRCRNSQRWSTRYHLLVLLGVFFLGIFCRFLRLPRRVVLGEQPGVSGEQSPGPPPVVLFSAGPSTAAPLPSVHTPDDPAAETSRHGWIPVSRLRRHSVDLRFIQNLLEWKLWFL